MSIHGIGRSRVIGKVTNGKSQVTFKFLSYRMRNSVYTNKKAPNGDPRGTFLYLRISLSTGLSWLKIFLNLNTLTKFIHSGHLMVEFMSKRLKQAGSKQLTILMTL
jgi:hypothetical protein